MTEKRNIIATDVIEGVVNNSDSDRVPIKDLIDAMDSVGFGLAIMIFSLGILIPLPPPLPSIIAVPLIILSIQMIIGYNSPKLPKRFSSLSIKRSMLAMIIKKSSPYIRMVEKILKPRLSFITSLLAERIIGVFILIFSSSILMPIPLSNLIPGLGVLIISFGLMGKDGLIVIFGITVGITGVVIAITTIIMGVEALSYIKDLIF